MYRINASHIFCALIFWSMALAGCNAVFFPPTHDQKPIALEGDHFVLVTASEQDTFSSLAQTYLNDARKGWWIAQYNQMEAVYPGQKLVVPKMPLGYGGLAANGYQTVPALLYNHMASQPKGTLSVSSQNFERQLIYLKENDFVTISLDQLNAYLNIKDNIPSNAVIISFDTADPWVYEIAFPILKKHGMRAALFVPAEQVGHPGKLAWHQVATMAAQGIDIGAHGPKIQSMKGKSQNHLMASLDNYILQAKMSIERNVNKPCRDYSVSSETINDLTTALLKKHGFRSGFTLKRGHNPFFVHNYKIRRSTVPGHYNLHQFGQNLVTFRKAHLK